MKQNNLLKLSLMILMMFFAATSAWGQLARWNPESLGQTWGPSPWAATAKDTNVTVTGLVRGSGLGTSGTPASNAFGGSGAGQNTVATAISGGDIFTMTIKANTGYKMSITGIPTWFTRKSGSGTISILTQYSINGGTSYTDIGSINVTSTSGTGSATPLAFPTNIQQALTDIPSTTTVTFRFVVISSANANLYMVIGSGDRFVIGGTATVASSPCATPTGSIVEDIVEAVVPNTATFAVNNATNYTSVQWQLSTNQGGTWSNINGANQISYTTGATTIAMDGYMYRAVLTNASSNCTTTTHQTNPAYLFVNISDEPTISVGSVPAFSTTTGETDTEIITISGINLEGDITLVLSDNTHFDISHDSFPETGGNVNSTLTITYSPLTAGNHSATITFSSPNAVDLILNLNGTASLGVPVATEATDVSYNNFTANWDAVLGAESYEIDVYTIQGSAPVPVNVVGWNFTDNNVTADDGIAGNLNKTISTNSSGTINWLSGSGNSNPPAISSSGWDGGSGSKYWQVSFTTIGISNMKLSSVQRSSNTGPGNFKVQYSLNGSSWFDVAGGAVTVDNDFTTGKLTNVSLPSACENQSLVYLRWIMTNNIQADGEGNVASAGTSAIDDILVTGEQGGTSVVYILQDENVGNITSYEVTDLDPETIYSYVVRALAGAATTTNSNEITVETTAIPAGAIWENGEWLAGIEPDIDTDVTINGDFYISDYDSFEAKTLTVNGSLLIETDYTITVNGLITNNAGSSNFIVENGANLIQLTDGSNIGEITVIRNSQPMKRLDYTLWSSPVIGQNLFGFSPDTVNGITNYPGSTGRIYIYDGVADTYINPNPFTADAVMNEAVGYLFRAPNNYHATNEVVYQGTFTGTPFNGGLTVPVYPTKYTSVGNPYPSNIDSELFMAANGNVSTLYFWNNTGQAGMNYATYTTLGGSPAGGGSETPTDFISVGQGFLVESSSSSVTFNNEMRVSDATIFFKENTVEKHRFWLSLNNESNQNLNNILVGYMSGATQGVDNQIDGKQFASQGSALYSIISQEKFAIQGRALPFENTDVVTLGFQAAEAGKFNISLSNFDGLFTEGEVIVYLKDKQLDITHNLMESSYTFESAAGEFKERFEVVYQTEGTMGIGDLASAAVLIYKNNQNIVVESKNEKILSVELFDLSGRNIHSNNKVNANTYQIKSNAQGVLVVKVQTQNGEVVTKKVINK